MLSLFHGNLSQTIMSIVSNRETHLAAPVFPPGCNVQPSVGKRLAPLDLPLLLVLVLVSPFSRSSKKFHLGTWNAIDPSDPFPESPKQDPVKEVAALQLLQSQSHINVEELEEAMADDTTLYKVTPWYEGGELFDLAPMPEESAKIVFAQLVDALDFVHSRGALDRSASKWGISRNLHLLYHHPPPSQPIYSLGVAATRPPVESRKARGLTLTRRRCRRPSLEVLITPLLWMSYPAWEGHKIYHPLLIYLPVDYVLIRSKRRRKT